MVGEVITKQNNQYWAGDSCCPDAPDNGHHWLPLKGGEPGELYCHYCYAIRKIDIPWNVIRVYDAETGKLLRLCKPNIYNDIRTKPPEVLISFDET